MNRITHLLATILFVFVTFSIQAHAATSLKYRVTDLGFLPSVGGLPQNTLATALNNAGQVVGGASVGSDGYAFIWDVGHGIQVLDMLPLAVTPTPYEVAYGINASGVIAGQSISGASAFIWEAGSGTRSLDGGFLGGGVARDARDINDSGTVVGTTYRSNSPYTWNAASGVSPLGTGFGTAVAINNAGQVVGQSVSVASFVGGFLWDSSAGFVPIGTLPGSHPSVPSDINDAGVVVGNTKLGVADQGFIWDGTHGIRYIGDLLDAGAGSTADAINDLGYVVGRSQSFAGSTTYIWHESMGMVDLNLSIDPSDPLYGDFRMFTAEDINDRGQIIGTGLVNEDGRTHSFLLSPVPEPETYAMFLAGLGLLGLAMRRCKA